MPFLADESELRGRYSEDAVIRGSALLAVLVMAGGCGPSGSGSGGAASARLALQNMTGVGAGLAGNSAGGVHLDAFGISSTHYFAMKLSNVSLVEDVDPVTLDNRGQVAQLWVSPHCTSADDCDFFDFARPTAAVNAELNSQRLDVFPGSYRYVRLTFCYDGDRPTKPNIAWSGGAMTSPHAILEMRCAVTSAKVDPPLVLEPGDSVAVALGYDLSGATWVDTDAGATMSDGAPAGGFEDCVVDAAASTRTCFRFPQFTPSAVKDGAGGGATVVAPPAADGGTDGGADGGSTDGG